MIIGLRPEHPQLRAINITIADSTEFANLLRELKKERDFDAIEGRFKIHRVKKRLVIELDFDEK